MEIGAILLLLLLVSFLGSFMSLRSELKKPHEVKKAQENLAKEKILFSEK